MYVFSLPCLSLPGWVLIVVVCRIKAPSPSPHGLISPRAQLSLRITVNRMGKLWGSWTIMIIGGLWFMRRIVICSLGLMGRGLGRYRRISTILSVVGMKMGLGVDSYLVISSTLYLQYVDL